MKKANAVIENETSINPDAAVDEVKTAKPKKEHPKLDRTRSFGMISGEVEGFPGACYAQDGKFYDSNGNKLING